MIAGGRGATATAASETLAVVDRYIDAFNRGDADGMAAAFASPGVILDGMAPHLWSGPGAARDWWRDVLAEADHHGASDYRVTLDEPAHRDVTGDAAYLVLPAAMTFKVQGQEVRQVGATFTVALTRAADGWRIAAWAWSKGTRAP